MTLPRLIHHTWKHPHLSAPLKHCVESFRKLNPGWEMRFYTDADCEQFVARFFPAFYPTFMKYPAGILRADVFRVLILYKFGGVYADIDVECLRPLDDLLKEVGQTDWEIFLTLDHPVHERVHYSGRKMWMNDFMIAKAGARFLASVMVALEKNAHGFYRPAEAVFATGPGLFTSLVERAGGPEQAGISPLPWQWIHPLPDMALDFEERSDFERMIVEQQWRDHFNPFVVHYWYHTWSSKLTTLDRYAKALLQSDGQIVEHRLQKFISALGSRVDSVGRALAEFAESGSKILIELAGDRLVSQEGHPWHGHGFRTLAMEILENLDVRFIHVSPHGSKTQTSDPPGSASSSPLVLECWKQNPSDFLSTWSAAAGLIYMAQGDCNEEGALRHQADALTIITRNLIRPGGFVLIEDHQSEPGATPKSKYSRTIFENAGFSVLEESSQLLLQRPDFPIPKVVHVLTARLAGAPMPSGLLEWLDLQKNYGWHYRLWDASDVRAFLEKTEPHLIDLLLSWPEVSGRRNLEALFLLRQCGGVIVDATMTCHAHLEDCLSGKRLVFLEREPSARRTSSPKSSVSEYLMASSPMHPFWAGVERDVVERKRNHPNFTVGSEYLTQRICDSVRFLPERDHPQILPLSVFIAENQPTLVPAPSQVAPPVLCSRLCNERDFQAEWLQEAAVRLGETLRYHRKIWEHCFILQALKEHGFLNKGKRGLVFASEADPLIEILAASGCEVTVIDTESLRPAFRSRPNWRELLPHSTRRHLSGEIAGSISFSSAQLIPVPPAGEFDFACSSSVLHHFNGRASWLRFLKDLRHSLRPDGAAVLATDYELSTVEGDTPDQHGFRMKASDLPELLTDIAACGWRLDFDPAVGGGMMESFIDVPPYAGPAHLRALIHDRVLTSAGLILERTADEPGYQNGSGVISVRPASRGFLYVGGGLGDVARRFYLSTTYELLDQVRQPTSIICYSHNPAALEFFRFHPNHKHFVLYDVGHIYMDLLRDPCVPRNEINRRLFAACGFDDSAQIARRRDPQPLRRFHAPDAVPDLGGHIVIHPFGRGWGDWPEAVLSCLRSALREISAETKVFVVSADYTAVDGKKKTESLDGPFPNVVLLKNLSAPAVFSLVASASRFIGTMSSLAQVAAFEGVPSLIFHPARCRDFQIPHSDYGRTIVESNCLAIPYDLTPAATVEAMLGAFLQNPHLNITVRDLLQKFPPTSPPPPL